jgi:hypothetical protein
MKVLLVHIANPPLLGESIRLEPSENLTYNAAQYGQFFTDTVPFFPKKGIDVCGIICEDLPAQVKGLAAFLVAQTCRKFPITCLNHICNLRFSHVVRTGPMRETYDFRARRIPNFIPRENIFDGTLSESDSYAMAYPHDVIAFISDNIETTGTAPAVHIRAPVIMVMLALKIPIFAHLIVIER